MAVYVYRTGKISNGATTGLETAVQVLPTTMNDDTGTNTVRVILWNTPTGAVKTLIAQTTVSLTGNGAVLHTFTALTSAVTEFAVEMRFSNEFMIGRVQLIGNALIGGAGTGLNIGPGDMKFDFSSTQSP